MVRLFGREPIFDVNRLGFSRLAAGHMGGGLSFVRASIRSPGFFESVRMCVWLFSHLVYPPSDAAPPWQ